MLVRKIIFKMKLYLSFPVLFFFQVSRLYLVLFSFHIRKLLLIFFNSVGLLVMNSLRLCSSENVFISLLFLKLFSLNRDSRLIAFVLLAL